MIDLITIGQTHLIWPVLIGSGLLWLFFIWKEWTDRKGPRFYIKLLVSLVGIFALAMIALQPGIHKKDKISYTAILTPHYQMTQLDSLKTVHKNLTKINYSPGKYFSGDIQKGQEVFLLGQGLRSYDLWQLDDTKVQLLPQTQPSGLSRLTFESENVIGTDLLIKGQYLDAPKGRQLLLAGPGERPLDSVSLKAGENQKFDLKAPLHVSGKYVYRLIEKDITGTVVSADPIAINIKANMKLNILMVNQFPSFETKYLKNFLAEAGHSLRVRNQVSKGRYKYEFFNSQQKGRIELNNKTLYEIDLLIIDFSSLKQASKSTLQSIRSAISENGLGLFIQADGDLYRSSISLLDFSFLKQEDEQVTVRSYPVTGFSKYPFVFKNDPLLESIQQSDKGIVTAYKRSGAGRIGTTLLKNTYELLLEGKTKVYQRLWSNTLSMISKRKAKETVWRPDAMWAYQDTPFHFEITTSQENPAVKSEKGFTIPMAQDIDIKDLWRGTTYPRNQGWNRLLMSHDSTEVFDFYVLDTTNWTSLVSHKTMTENKWYFDQIERGIETNSYTKTIEPWWFFMVFLLTMAFLWLEPKLLG